MKTLLEQAMLEGLAQSYRNSTDPDLLALIDSINQGDRTALAPLSDYYRAKGKEDKADMFLWCWKMARWPRFNQKINKYEFYSCKIGQTSTWKDQEDDGSFIGLARIWGFYAGRETTCLTLFGSFELFYDRMWSQCPKHTANLMKELQ